MGKEKKLSAPLICAALSQPVLEVKERKFDSLPSDDTVMPSTGVAAFDRDPSVKLKFAKVAAWADENPKITARLSLLNREVIMRG